MKFVVFGAGGLLGRHLLLELQTRNINALGVTRQECAIDRFDLVQKYIAAGDTIINAAAYTNVDGAETDSDQAYRTNAAGAEQLARAAELANATIVHISTDFVFDGESNRPYDEFDLPVPQSIYGRSKRAGEILVESAARKHHIVRVQGLYGTGGRNFFSRLPEFLRKDAANLRIDAERRVQPTSAATAARAIIDIARSDYYGYWHASCQGATTWHLFAVRMAELLGVPINWQAVGSAELKLPAARPDNCLLEHRRLKLTGLSLLPTWQEALSDFINSR